MRSLITMREREREREKGYREDDGRVYLVRLFYHGFPIPPDVGSEYVEKCTRETIFR